MAMDRVDPDPRLVTDVLDGIDGAWQRAAQGRAEAAAGSGIRIESL